VAELAGSRVPIHACRGLPDPKCLFDPSGLSLCLPGDQFITVPVDDVVLFHVIDWESAEVVAREAQRQTRRIKGALWTRKTPTCMNRDAGSYQLSHTWDQVISGSRAPSRCRLNSQRDVNKMSDRHRNVKVKIKVHTLDIAPLRSETPPQKRSGTARFLKGFHSFTRTPTRSSAIGMSHTCLCLPSRSWYLFTDPGGMEG